MFPMERKPRSGSIMTAKAAFRRDLNAMNRKPAGRTGGLGWLVGSSGPRAGAQQADGGELGLLAGLFLRPLAHLVALVEKLHLLHFLEGLAERSLGVLELDLELVGRALEVLAPLHRRLGIGRIGEMAGVVNPGAVLLGLDLALEIAADALEFGDHALDLCNLAPLLVDLKLLQANERLA